MRDFAIARHNVRQYRGRLTSLALVIALGCIIALGCVGVVARAASSSAHAITSSLALRTIDVLGGAAHPGSTLLTGPNVAKIKSLGHVVEVQPSLQASFGIKNDQIPGALFIGTIPQLSALPPIVARTRNNVFPLSAGEVVLPASIDGVNMHQLLGESVVASYTVQLSPGAGTLAPVTVHVVGLYSTSYTADGPTAAYAYAPDVVKWAAAKAGAPSNETYLDSVGYQQAAVIVDDSKDLSQVEATLATDGYQAASIQQQLSALPSQLVLIRDLGYVVFGLLILYSIISGLSLANSFVKNRTREIGLMKAIGFQRLRVFKVLSLELLIAGVLTAGLGVVLGNIASFAASAILNGRQVFGVPLSGGASLPPLMWSVFMFVVPIAAVLVGGALPAYRSAKLEADVALRDWR